MNRRNFLRLAGGTAALGGLAPISTFANRSSGQSRRPNILFILSDEHHPWRVGYRGLSQVNTPNIDRIANTGRYFTRAYCNSPLCGPSRMSLMTGKYIHDIRVWSNLVALDRSETTWAHRFHEAGIPAYCFGKMDSPGQYQRVGFTQYRRTHRRKTFNIWPMNSPYELRLKGYTRHVGAVDEPGTREEGLEYLLEQGEITSTTGLQDFGHHRYTGFYDHDRRVTDWSVEFIRQQHEENPDQPWILHAGYLFPHWPFRVPEEYFQRYFPDNIDLPHDARFPNPDLHPALRHFQETCQYRDMTGEKLRNVIAAYYGMITCMDDMIGDLLRVLEETGELDNTYIIYTSDHGEGMGEHGLFLKNTPYEGSVGIPLAVNGPGIEPGEPIDSPVSLVDLFPTLLDMAGLPEEAELPGESWLPLLRDQESSRRDYAFAEYHGVRFRADWYMLVRDRYKYVYYTNGHRPSLFDIRDDPEENTDLAKQPGYGEVLREFETLLRAIVDPEAVAGEAKSDLGLIGSDGEDYTRSLSIQELRAGRKRGEFPPKVPRGFER